MDFVIFLVEQFVIFFSIIPFHRNTIFLDIGLALVSVKKLKKAI